MSCEKPGNVISPERTPPPGVEADSSTTTDQPACASRMAAARPLGPAPTTIASVLEISGLFTFYFILVCWRLKAYLFQLLPGGYSIHRWYGHYKQRKLERLLQSTITLQQLPPSLVAGSMRARTGAQIGGGQGEVQGRLVAIYLSAKTVTFPFVLRIGCQLKLHEMHMQPLQDFPQCKRLRREPTRKVLKLANHRISPEPGHQAQAFPY